VTNESVCKGYAEEVNVAGQRHSGSGSGVSIELQPNKEVRPTEAALMIALVVILINEIRRQ